MEIADLYIRVSTDEQADKGYSQRNQEEMLRKYCNLHAIQVRKVIYEDHSAKTFNRPQWKNYLRELKKYKGKSDLVLFTKWDRFSRNAGDAYQMINILRKCGVEPQAIEQPLDLSIPENKMMLAFYLAAPEVENDRRALNVFFGMRRARKEGRYMGLAPIGYENKTTEDGRKYIAPKEPEAGIMRWVFETLKTRQYNTDEVWRQAKEKGLKCCKSRFHTVIRNAVYCGKIFIPKYKDEESRFKKGQHEEIISEALFYEVQDVLDGRGRHYRPKSITLPELPLRGFLICPVCGKILTGSKSRGRNQYYAYYHCFGGCKQRFPAEEVNKELITELGKYCPREEMLELYENCIITSYNSITVDKSKTRRQIMKEIKELDNRLSYARELLSTRKIEVEDFRAMKTEYTAKLEKLEAKLSGNMETTDSIEALLSKGIGSLLRLDQRYIEGNIEEKRKIIGSMYPEKLGFDGLRLRTNRVNEIAMYIYKINKLLSNKKSRTNGTVSNLSGQVGKTGFELLNLY